MIRGLPIACLGLALLAPEAVAQAGAGVTIEEVLAAWSARHAATKSGRFRLSEEYIKPAGGDKDGKGGGSRSPERDTKCLAEHDIAFEGRRYRHATSGTRWHNTDGACVPCNDVLTFDGELSRLFRPTSPGADRPQGSVSPGTKMISARNLLLTPIFCCLRANEPYLVAVNPDELRVTDRSLNVDGRRCLELVSERPGGRGNVLRVWVDPAMKFVPVRLTKEEGGDVAFEITITHEPHELVGGLPKSWASSQYGRKHALTETRIVRATHAEINVKVSDSEFTIEFPPGTFLYDDRTQSYGLVKEGNTQRKLTREEMQRPYSEQLQLDGPTTSIDHPDGRRRWLWAIGGAVVVGATGVSVWR